MPFILEPIWKNKNVGICGMWRLILTRTGQVGSLVGRADEISQMEEKQYTKYMGHGLELSFSTSRVQNILIL